MAIVEKEMSATPKLSIICDSHPLEQPQYISTKDGTMHCSKCLIEKHHKMVKNCKQMDTDQMFQQVKDARDQLMDKRDLITQALEKLNKIVMVENGECEEEPLPIPSSDFVQLLKSVKELLGTKKETEGEVEEEQPEEGEETEKDEREEEIKEPV